MINKLIKLFCPKCNQIREFEVQHKFDINSHHDVNDGVIDFDDFDPNVDIRCEVNVEYEISMKCSHCNHEMFNETGDESYKI